MGFLSLMIIGILMVIFFVGLLLCLLGLIFLIVFLVRRKVEKVTGLLVAAIVLLAIGVPAALSLPAFVLFANFMSSVP